MNSLDPFLYRNIVFFTGAGMSQECGIPTCRGQGGVWEQYNYQDYARENKALTVEINPEATDRSGMYTMTLREKASLALERLFQGRDAL